MPDELFSIVPRHALMALSTKGASARECIVLFALMHHEVNEHGEIGVSKSGYVMSSTDIAEYANMSSPSAARTALKGLRDKGIVKLSRKTKVNNFMIGVHKIVSQPDASDDERFTIVDRDTLLMMVESKLSAREMIAVTALMHIRSGDEVGVYGDYAMCASDVAEYSGLASADSVRHALKGLRDKGVIEVSRRISYYGSDLPVYRMALHHGQTTICKNERNPMSNPILVACRYQHGSHVETDTDPMSKPTQTPIRPNNYPIRPKNYLKVVANDQRFNSQKFVPKYPYPSCSEEVSDYVSRLAENTDNDAITYIVDDDRLIEDFYWMNENNGWVLPDGTPIRDWTKMLISFAEKIYRDFEQSFTY